MMSWLQYSLPFSSNRKHVVVTDIPIYSSDYSGLVVLLPISPKLLSHAHMEELRVESLKMQLVYCNVHAQQSTIPGGWASCYHM